MSLTLRNCFVQSNGLLLHFLPALGESPLLQTIKTLVFILGLYSSSPLRESPPDWLLLIAGNAKVGRIVSFL